MKRCVLSEVLHLLQGGRILMCFRILPSCSVNITDYRRLKHMLVFATTGMMFIMDFIEHCWSTALHICSLMCSHVSVTCFIIKWHCEVGLKLFFKNPCFWYSIILKLSSLLKLAELNHVNGPPPIKITLFMKPQIWQTHPELACITWVTSLITP